MMEALTDKFAGVVAGQGNALKSMGERERESVLSEARTQTQWLDSPKMQETLTRSDFRIAELRTGKLSVFLCLPARYMDTHDRWLRVIVNLAVGKLELRGREAAAKSAPVLLLLEEFPVLRHMEKLETAAGLLAGSGVKMWIILQDLSRLKQHYKRAGRRSSPMPAC